MRYYLLLYLLIFCFDKSTAQTRVDSLLTVLKKEIEQKDIYVQQKLRRIEKIKAAAPTVSQKDLVRQYHYYNDLYHQYKTFIYDSAFKYAQKLIETSYRLNDKSKIGYARVKLSFILISSGMFKETFDSLKSVEVRYLPDTTRVDYYRLLARAYSDLIIYNRDDFYKKIYADLDITYMDSALQWCERGSYNDYYLNAVKNVHQQNYQKAIDIVLELFSKQKLTHPQLAVNYYDLGNAYLALQDSDKGIESITLSSLSDIRASTKETAAMHTLAKLLYEKGDVKNAYLFIRQALDDAEFYGARQRKVEIGSILPVIASAELTHSELQRKLWIRYVIGLSVLSALVMIFTFIIFKQLRKLKAAEAKIIHANESLQQINQKLQEANKIKEEYIGYYFGINSAYLDKMEGLKRALDQKVSAKKYDDIKYLVNSINLKHDREELSYGFDKVFLKIFPDFIPTFNSYFRQEDRQIPKDGQLMNTELRIFALIRLGITDTEKIAKILDYSVNTIYAYKNRVKSKSILPNDQFEQKIMEIKTV